MPTAVLTNHESDTCPRVAALMAGLASVNGDRETACTWLLELIAWMAFDNGRVAGGVQAVSRLAELRV